MLPTVGVTIILLVVAADVFQTGVPTQLLTVSVTVLPGQTAVALAVIVGVGESVAISIVLVAGLLRQLPIQHWAV